MAKSDTQGKRHVKVAVYDRQARMRRIELIKKKIAHERYENPGKLDIALERLIEHTDLS